MNRPPHRPSSDHVTDEDLSALADGVLAVDDAALVEDHVGHCPDCSARLAAFGAARDALRRSAGDPAESVDDVTRRRMISTAVNAPVTGMAARASGPTARTRALAVAAVALLAVAAVATLRVTSDDENQLASGEGGPSGLPIGADRVGVTDGPLDDPNALASALAAAESGAIVNGIEGSQDFAGGEVADEALAGGRVSQGGGAMIVGPTTTAPSEAGEGKSDAAGAGETTSESVAESIPPSPPAPRPAQGTASPSTVRSASPDDLRAIARCYRTVKSPESGSALTAALTGTYQNAPVIVLGFRSPDKRTLAMILARDSCTIVTAQSFR